MDIKIGRHTANYSDDFVVLFIGFRINKLLRVNEWLPVMRAANSMTKNALKLPGQPLLNSQTVWSIDDPRVLFFVQHWRSFDALIAWANDNNLDHKSALKDFFKRTGYNGNVGIWHEAYKLSAGQFETIYANMPRMSLAAAGEYSTLREASRGNDRMGDPKAR
ncbi:DUF4188 domain-containing protein [Acinetobacter sp. ANC 4779]|uniref:monooxygenase family protein n=1 Tax=Acinetobacter sp. ANC 4779 TaxID=2529848 RepID=UPI0010392CF1|nr:DUF4188 domain-containing protein [Acinetobacter sp. ANC 4779]TCB51531.1 DUF4188 domain-containing protein [Acinetobacter sp. ANC 4779]